MTHVDRYLLVRAASLYLTALVTLAVWIWRRPSRRAIAGAALACCCSIPAILALNVLAACGWWHLTRGGCLLGTPVDLGVVWLALWGLIPALAFLTLRMAVVVLVALAIDLVLMPAAAPVVRLGPLWLAGEAIGLFAVLVPAQFLARWTACDQHLAGRALLQVIAFSGLMVFVLPAIVIEASLSAWVNSATRPRGSSVSPRSCFRCPARSD